MDTTHAVTLGDRGRLVVPSSIRVRQRWSQGTPLVLVETEAGVVMTSRDQLKTLIRRQLAGVSLVDELLEERRRSAASEDAA